ncbi:MAG: hypothetical protein ACTHOD_09110 [Motilibacteraceae bacterium]
MDPVRRRWTNRLTLATPLGLLVARLGGAVEHPPPPALAVRLLRSAVGYRLPVPPAPAFTVGDVVVVRRAELLEQPALMAHEARHADQYARCGGPLMVPLYLLAAAWSWALTGDWGARNVFEVRAGLADGGYPPRPLRPAVARLAARPTALLPAGPRGRTSRARGPRPG